MLTKPVEYSVSLPEACERFLAEIGDWVAGCITRYDPLPPTNVHDQATYTTGWEPYIRAIDDKQALDFVLALRDKIRDHYVETGLWRHGYWTMQEAHHGTEHYELFLGTLHRLKPDDAETGRQLVDAAEHLGNWVDAVPPWFDWEAGLFRSLFFGAEGIRSDAGTDLNTPDHLRCANIGLLAYRASGEKRFKDLAGLYAGNWAEAILAREAIPIGLTVAGPLYSFDSRSESLYRSFAGEAPDLDSAVDRAENFLTSDAINTFLTLWKLTGQADFRGAAEKLLDVLATQLDDPDAGAAADALRCYRAATNDGRYGSLVLDAVAKLAPDSIETLTLDAGRPRGRRESGIGKRGDLPAWLENGQLRRHSPITLAVAAEISADEALATLAVDLARTYFVLARDAFPDGRDHGCAARSVSAVARGHGRENHVGMTTAVLGPIMVRFLNSGNDSERVRQ